MIALLSMSAARAFAGVVKGAVVDAAEDSPIVGASVKAFGSDSAAVAATTTGVNGEFSLAIGSLPARCVEVAFTGYETASVAVEGNADADLGAIRLQPKSVMLSSVTVTAEMHRQDATTETFLLTDSVRASAPNAAMMIGNLPGFKVDWISEDISIGKDKNVPIIVNGRKVGLQYAKSLNPKRIKSIQVQRFPPGEFSDIPVLINIVLYENYIGWDVSGGARGIASFRNRHTNSESASADATLSTKDWNAYASASFMRRDYYSAASFAREIAGEQPEASAPIDVDKPNQRNMSHTYAMSIGADRKLGNSHTLSAQTWLDRASTRSADRYDMESGLAQINADRYKSLNSITGLFYQGVINDRLTLYSSLLYNYYDIDENRDFSLGPHSSPSKVNGRKDYVYLMANVSYFFSNKFNATLSYNYTWRKYRSQEDGSPKPFVSRENRSKAEASIGYTPANSFSIRVGASVLDIHTRQNGANDSHTTWVPRVQLYWRPLKWLTLTGMYYNTTQYPNLDQLSPSSWLISANLEQTGNPKLKSMVVHSAHATATLFNWLSVNYMWRKSNDDIADWYELTSPERVTKTFINCDYLHQYLGISADKDLGKGFRINFVGNYQWYKRQMRESKNNGRTWYGDLTATWAIGQTSLSIIGEYFIRHDMEPLPQGKRYNEEEALVLGANYRMLKGRLSISAGWSIPVSLIDKRTYTKINIPGFRSETYGDDRINASMVRVNVRYSFGKGKVSKKSNDYVIDSEK